MYVLLIGILGKWSRTERSGELRERLDGDGEISFFSGESGYCVYTVCERVSHA